MSENTAPPSRDSSPAAAESLRPSRRLDGSPGVIDVAAARNIYRRSAGWASQRMARAASLVSRHASADDSTATSDLLLARVPAMPSSGAIETSPAERTAPTAAAASVAASPHHADASFATADAVAAPASPAAPGLSALTARLHRRIAESGMLTAQPSALRPPDAGIALRSGLHERLAARGEPTTQTSPAPAQLARSVYRRASGDSPASSGAAARAVSVNNSVDEGVRRDAASLAVVGVQRKVASPAPDGPGTARPLVDAGLVLANASAAVADHAETSIPAPQTLARLPEFPSLSANATTSPRPPIAQVGRVDLAATTVRASALPAMRSNSLSHDDFAPLRLATATPTIFRKQSSTAQAAAQGAAQNIPSVSSPQFDSATLLLVGTHTSSAAQSPNEQWPARASAAGVSAGPMTLARRRDQSAMLANDASIGAIPHTAEISIAATPAADLVWRTAADTGARAIQAAAPASATKAMIMRAAADGGGNAMSANPPPRVPAASADTASAPAPAPMPDLDQLAEHVMRRIARRLEIERDRRGGKSWI